MALLPKETIGDERISTFVAIMSNSSSSSYGSPCCSKAEFNMFWYRCREDVFVGRVGSAAIATGGRISMFPCSSSSSSTVGIIVPAGRCGGGGGGGVDGIGRYARE